MKESPRLRLALRAVGNDRETFEEAYRTMKAPEIEELYGLTAYDVTLLREHWAIAHKFPLRSSTIRQQQEAQADPDQLAEKVAALLAPQLEQLTISVKQLAAAVRRVEERVSAPPFLLPDSINRHQP